MPYSELAIEDLEAGIGVTFNNRGLLKQALVHRSYLNEHGGSPLESYERMEFLGDAVLELIVSTELYHSFPGITEGELTKGRSSVVCRPSLARAARRLSIGKHLYLGKGELESGGQDRESILEEAFESLVAAVYLDRGYQAARDFVLTALKPEIDKIGLTGGPVENPKSRLQELMQGAGRSTPRYRHVSTEGPDHQPEFTVEVLVDDVVLGQGKGSKKSDAERAAAQFALSRSLGDADEEITVEATPSAGRSGGNNVQRAQGTGPNTASNILEESCSHFSKETGKVTRKRPTKASSEAGNAGSGESSMSSGPLTWMKRFGKNWKRS